MASSPTLAATWSPAANCVQQISELWNWRVPIHPGTSYATLDVLGAPTDTTSCMPPHYTPTGFYYGTGCPTGFTSACGVQGVDVTCCPTYVLDSPRDDKLGRSHGVILTCWTLDTTGPTTLAVTLGPPRPFRRSLLSCCGARRPTRRCSRRPSPSPTSSPRRSTPLSRPSWPARA